MAATGHPPAPFLDAILISGLESCHSSPIMAGCSNDTTACSISFFSATKVFGFCNGACRPGAGLDSEHPRMNKTQPQLCPWGAQSLNNLDLHNARRKAVPDMGGCESLFRHLAKKVQGSPEAGQVRDVSGDEDFLDRSAAGYLL